VWFFQRKHRVDTVLFLLLALGDGVTVTVKLLDRPELLAAARFGVVGPHTRTAEPLLHEFGLAHVAESVHTHFKRCLAPMLVHGVVVLRNFEVVFFENGEAFIHMLHGSIGLAISGHKLQVLVLDALLVTQVQTVHIRASCLVLIR